MKLAITNDGVVHHYYGSGGRVVIPEGIKYFSRNIEFHIEDGQVEELCFPASFLGHASVKLDKIKRVETYEYDFDDADIEQKLSVLDELIKQRRIERVSKTRRGRKPRTSDMIDDFQSFFLVCPALRGLKRYSVAEDNPYYCSKDGLLFSKDGRTLISIPCDYDDKVKIPESVTQIDIRSCRYRERPLEITLEHRTLLETWFCMIEKVFSCQVIIYADKLKEVIERDLCEVGNFVGDDECLIKVSKRKNRGNCGHTFFSAYCDEVYFDDYYERFNIESMILPWPNIDIYELSAQLQVAAAMGYIYFKDRYSKSSARDCLAILDRHSDYIYKLAEKKKYTQVLHYYDTKVEYWNLEDYRAKSNAESAFVYELNHNDVCECVLRGSASLLKRALKLSNIIDSYNSYPEAPIILACRYGGIEKLKVLLADKRYYDKCDNYNLVTSFFHNYAELFVFPPHNYIWRVLRDHVFNEQGDLLKYQPLPETERAEILKLILSVAKPSVGDINNLCVYALMYGCNEIAKVLMDYGIDIERFMRFMTGSNKEALNNLLNKGMIKNPEGVLTFVKELHKIGKPLFICAKHEIRHLISKPQILQEFLSVVNITMPFLKALVRDIAAENALPAMNALLNSGRKFTPVAINSFIEIATEMGKGEIVAAILDYQNAHNTKTKKASPKVRSKLSL